jgi:hypothetical protein
MNFDGLLPMQDNHFSLHHNIPLICLILLKVTTVPQVIVAPLVKWNHQTRQRARDSRNDEEVEAIAIISRHDNARVQDDRLV